MNIPLGFFIKNSSIPKENIPLLILDLIRQNKLPVKSYDYLNEQEIYLIYKEWITIIKKVEFIETMDALKKKHPLIEVAFYNKISDASCFMISEYSKLLVNDNFIMN